MSDNPLVEPPKDSTEWYTGIGIAEAISDVVTGIQSGDWIDVGFGAVGGALEALSAVMDPLGTLFSWSISWLIEHVKPLTDALDWLAGDADEVAAQAATWRNVAESLRGTAETLESDVRHDTTGWTGKAADAYRTRMEITSQLIRAQSQAAEGMGTATELCGTLVGTVREAVRDFVADCVGRLAAWAIEVLASEGYAIPVVIEQASLRVARWGVRIIEMLTKLVRTLGNLVPQLNKLGELIGRIGELLDKMAAGKPLPRPPEPPKPPDEPPDPGNPDDPPDEPPEDPPNEPGHPDDPDDPLDPANVPDPYIDNTQFGKKIRKHAADFGLDPSNPEDRQWLRTHIQDTMNTPEVIRHGPWAINQPGGGQRYFFEKGNDVVVTTPEGKFVTILKDAADSNGWYLGAEKVGK